MLNPMDIGHRPRHKLGGVPVCDDRPPADSDVAISGLHLIGPNRAACSAVLPVGLSIHAIRAERQVDGRITLKLPRAWCADQRKLGRAVTLSPCLRAAIERAVAEAWPTVDIGRVAA